MTGIGAAHIGSRLSEDTARSIKLLEDIGDNQLFHQIADPAAQFADLATLT
jgi:hypothetical protein